MVLHDGLGIPRSRREVLQRAGLGIGGLGLASLMAGSGMADSVESSSSGPVAVGPHFAGKAKRVIHIFTAGGASQIDTFDLKPKLNEHLGRPVTEGTDGAGVVLKNLKSCPFKFARHGQSGIEVSELMPHTAGVIDDICVVRSMTNKSGNHELAESLMNTGAAATPRPCLGSWSVYGLGAENESLPAFVHLSPKGFSESLGTRGFSCSFLPGWTGGTAIVTGGIDKGRLDPARLLQNLRSGSTSLAEQRRQLDLVGRMHREFIAQHGDDAFLDGRIAQWETAFRMQVEANDAFDLSREPAHVHRLYGDSAHARECMLARRLVERGVRFVQIWHGYWDTHADNDERHRRLCRDGDQPLAALIKDLKDRDMLDDTLVIWAGEFGRTPRVDGAGDRSPGRAHNPGAFTILLAGGGFRGGYVHGTTDDFSSTVVENPMDVHDLHATILHSLGLDHTKLTFRHSGRDFRLTDIHGRVVNALFA